jgi:methyltransferase (TIGR00027 family)
LSTRAYRLPVLATVPVYEVDHPSTQRTKRRRVLGAIGAVPGNITFVPVEFGRDDPIAAIRAAGFLDGRRTLVLWEGVTNYLTSVAVDETFRSVGEVIGQGSTVIFTYIDRRMLDGTAEFEGASRSSRHVRSVGEPYTFGFEPGEVSGYLAERGYTLVSDETVHEASRRYSRDGKGSPGYAYYHVAEARRD